ncbi:MAG: DUF484 family protein [Alphaproteobacteria bacterium]|nr:DUF484 family protein [Alphaproteobacteria bacterium]
MGKNRAINSLEFILAMGSNVHNSTPSPLLASDVVDYLRHNPDFFIHHPDLLHKLTFPERFMDGNIVDLQKIVLDKLRHDFTQLQVNQETLLANSRDNLSTQNKIHQAILLLLTATDLSNFIDLLKVDVAVLLDVDVINLSFEENKLNVETPLLVELPRLPSGTIHAVMQGVGFLLRDEIIGDSRIFGNMAGVVRSDALMRLTLKPQNTQAILAFGVRHPGYFHAGQGIELLNFLARIIEYCLNLWIPTFNK